MPPYSNEQEDKWFRWKGVAPPTRMSSGITEDQIDELLMKRNHICDWKQEGPNAFCDEAPDYRHGFKIGINKRITGTGANGEPLIVDMLSN